MEEMRERWVGICAGGEGQREGGHPIFFIFYFLEGEEGKGNILKQEGNAEWYSEDNEEEDAVKQKSGKIEGGRATKTEGKDS